MQGTENSPAGNPPSQRPAPAPGFVAGPSLPGKIPSRLHVDVFVGRGIALASLLYPGRCTVNIGADATLYFEPDELERFRVYLATVAVALAEATPQAVAS